tara:strand:+ start:95198 stop:96004 length:807 start_codon:yes stop_codon:yes gene_type:complete
MKKSAILFLFNFFVISSLMSQNIVLNEFLAGTDTCCDDGTGEIEDFIELFNPGTTAVDIGGWYATDDASELTKHQIPSDSSNTIIPAGGYLVLWASGETSRGALHVDFKLKKGGEFIGLVLSDGLTVVDSLTFGSQTDDISYGRVPDGGSSWSDITTPTPGTSNAGLFIEDNISLPSDFQLQQNYPNPFNPTTSINFSVANSEFIELNIFDILGNKITTLMNNHIAPGNYNVQWNGKDFNGKIVSGGVYLYQLKSKSFNKTKKMIFIK